MNFNVRKTSAFAVLFAILFTSGIAFALNVPPPPEYSGRRDPNTPGGERVGAHEGFDGYPADPDEVDNQLYTDTQGEYRRYSPHWTGASWGFGLQGGAGWMYGQGFDEIKAGPAFGGFAQITTLMSVVDAIIAVNHSRFNSKIDNVDVQSKRLDISLSVTIHPMFFAGLTGEWFARFLSQLYLMGGGNLTIQNTKGENIDSRFTRPGFHLGGGIDTYITNPNRRASLWLGVQYRWVNTAGGLNDDHFRYKWTREHQIFARITIRFNGNIINSLPAPSSP